MNIEFKFEVPGGRLEMLVKEFLHKHGVKWTTRPGQEIVACSEGCGRIMVIRGEGGAFTCGNHPNRPSAKGAGVKE